MSMVVIIIITTITIVKSSRTCSSSTRTGAWRLELLFGCPPTKFTIFKTWPWLWFINYCNHDDDDDDDDEHLSFVIADKHNIVDLTWKGNIWLRSGNFWGIWDHFLKKSGKYIWYGLEKPASKFEIRNPFLSQDQDSHHQPSKSGGRWRSLETGWGTWNIFLFDINHGYLGLCQNLKNRYLNRVKSEQLYDWRCFDVVIYADTDHDHVGGNDCQD